MPNHFKDQIKRVCALYDSSLDIDLLLGFLSNKRGEVEETISVFLGEILCFLTSLIRSPSIRHETFEQGATPLDICFSPRIVGYCSFLVCDLEQSHVLLVACSSTVGLS